MHHDDSLILTALQGSYDAESVIYYCKKEKKIKNQLFRLLTKVDHFLQEF